MTRLFGGRIGSWLRVIVRRAFGRVRIRRRLPGSLGRLPLFVSPAATLEYLLPGMSCFDPELLAVATHYVQPGDCVWDVGANLGVFTLAAAYKSGGKVYAFEADPWLASLVRDSFQLNPNNPFHASVICGAVGAKTGISSFCVAQCGRASSFLKEYEGRPTAGGVEYELDVFTMSLDDMLNHLDKPDFVKIDVEGAELAVLHGAARLLRDVKPVLYIEVGMEACEQVGSILRDAGYELYRITGDAKIEQVDECCMNTLAVHQSGSQDRLRRLV